MNAAASPAVAAKRTRTILTPEGLALPLVIASRGARAGALIIDVMIILFALIAFHIVLIAVAGGLIDAAGGAIGGAPSGAAEFLQVLLIIGVFLSWYGYFLVQELGPRGATLGKRILGIRVAARGQARLTPEAIIARNLLRDIELFYPLVFIIASGLLTLENGAPSAMTWAAAGWFGLFLLLPFFNRDALRAGDIIAGTWVVEAPRLALADALSASAGTSGDSNLSATRYRFGAAALGIYGERELQVLERLLREGEPDALATVHRTICAKIGWEPGEGDERAFLEAFYAALRDKLEKDMRYGKRKADKFS
ncbi:MAG: RDD family protein [Erythrobacter sp.]